MIQTGWSDFITCGFQNETDFDIYEGSWTFQDGLLDIKITSELLTKQAEWFAGNLGPFCAGSKDLQYLAHINTPNIAYDLELIRNLTGSATLNYIGFDEGSVLGVTYAALFPDRVGKMVLDGKCFE